MIKSAAMLLICCLSCAQNPRNALNARELAWQSAKPNLTEHMQKAIALKEWPVLKEIPCKNMQTGDCVALVMSFIAKYESNFSSTTTFVEDFKDSSGKQIVSRGLFQMSIASVKQKQYACDMIKDEADLYDDVKSINCAVNIAHHWITRDMVIFSDKANLGLGRYWSTARPTSKSFKKIKDSL